ncbi:MAG: YdiU family protein [Campylobacterales bacterium]|nr:YdiU family protein [Campylobacterales bacterium]
MKPTIKTFEDFAKYANYTFTNTLQKDPHSSTTGIDHNPREVKSGHYVPVVPTPIKDPVYIAHSKIFFDQLGLDQSIAQSDQFIAFFSGDTQNLPKPLRDLGWACGYALSIYGQEYYQQCPFQTGNGYGDGRAISILEVDMGANHWEMQLKGGGKTPYCRGADGRAVLRSSIREFLAQEHMHALGIPTSRSLCLIGSKSETVKRPWFYKGSYSKDPELMIDESVAITTRVASSFIRVGQLELFARRSRKNEHQNALKELEQIVLYLIEKEYGNQIDSSLPLKQKVLHLAKEYQKRLKSLVVNWIKVGYCQGNFNSDNCAAGGFTLDYGPFGFIDLFDPRYQPWTGGGAHFSFFNQPQAAKINFDMFCKSLKPLLEGDKSFVDQLEQIQENFVYSMQQNMETMWSSKLGFKEFDQELFHELMVLMIDTKVDYTIFFRELSNIPQTIDPLLKSFYDESVLTQHILHRWEQWHKKWLEKMYDFYGKSSQALSDISNQMKRINPKYTLKEWFLVEAYEKANLGDFSQIYELQEVMTNPFDEQSDEIEQKYYTKKPLDLFHVAGVSHVSCSS